MNSHLPKVSTSTALKILSGFSTLIHYGWRLLTFGLLGISLGSCQAIGDIFGAGVSVGIFIAIATLILILILLRKVFSKKQ